MNVLALALAPQVTVPLTGVVREAGRLEPAPGRVKRAPLEGFSLALALAGGRYVQDWWSPRNEDGVAAAVLGYDLPVPVPANRALPNGWDAVLEAKARSSSDAGAELVLRGNAVEVRLSETTSGACGDPADFACYVAALP